MKRKLAGIYMIHHKSGFYYIGYSIDIFSRWSSHYTSIKMSTHSSVDLTKLWNSTEVSEWTFRILDTLSITEFKKEHQIKGKALETAFRRKLLNMEKEWMSLYSKNFALNKDNKNFG